MEFKTFEEAFVAIVQDIYSLPDYIEQSRTGEMYEVLGYKYEVDDPTSFKFANEELGRIKYDYADYFYNWMMSGCGVEATEAFKKAYPNVSSYLDNPKSDALPANFNVFYGPRIIEQLPYIIKELETHPNSRRAVINILQASDLQLLDLDEKLEYPCCDSAMFTIRNGKLNLHLHMRSNNMANVAKLDMYLWGRAQCEIAEKLGLPVGRFISTIGSAHIFSSDFDYLKSINVL